MKTILIALVVLSASAQTVSGPSLGWTVFPDLGVARSILGVPGAGFLGPNVTLPSDIQSAIVNPANSIALALAGNANNPVILDLTTLNRTPLDSARPSPDSAIWSPLGTALALIYNSAGWVQIFTSQAGVFQLNTEFSASATQASVSDDGSAFLALSASGLSLYSGGNASVVTADPTASFTFLANSTNVAFWSAQQLTIGSQTTALAADSGEQVYLASPASGRVVAVRSNAGNVAVFDGSGQMLGTSLCSCGVSGVNYIGRAATVRLQTSTDSPVWLTDASTSANLFFVPAGQ